VITSQHPHPLTILKRPWVRRARAVGAWLQENGFEGHRALLLYPPGLEFVYGFFGCMVGGVVAVPAPAPHGGQLHRALPRLRAMVSDAEAGVVLTTRQVISAVSAAGDAFPELARLAWVATEEIPDEVAASWRDVGIRPEDLAFLQYTSGSTSAPRGVMVSHGNLLHNQQVIASAMGHTPERVASWGGELWLSWLPTFHDMGLIGPVMQAVYAGGTTTLFPPFSFIRRPQRWLTAISKYQPHTSGGPNFAYELCLRHATPELLDRLDLRRWEVACNGAEPVRASTLRRFAEVFGKAGFRPEAFFPAYGLAEATLMVTAAERAALRVRMSMAVTRGSLRRHVRLSSCIPTCRVAGSW
jgi:acyl-CoA synthetase (AMP-forming)/AMP-acid ligase II